LYLVHLNLKWSHKALHMDLPRFHIHLYISDADVINNKLPSKHNPVSPTI
jgi:hypothetical protein